MWLLLAMALAQTPAKPLPPAGETAKLYFLAGDLAKAVDWASHGLKSDPKKCRPMLKALAEYAFLANHTDEFTPDQARDFIKWDHQISPGTPSKLTVPILERFVTGPLAHAYEIAATDPVQAQVLVGHVIAVDSANADALKLQKELASKH